MEDRFGRVLEHLYKAALGDVTWASAAGVMNDLIRTYGQSITYAEVGPGGEPEIQESRFFMAAECRDDLQQLYYRDYYWRDEAIPRLAGLDDRELAWKSDLYTDQEMRSSAAYNEFRVANKTQNGLFTAIHGLEGSVIVWSCCNSTEREGWGHDQVRIIELLAPHIRQAARVRRAMADARALGASLAGLLENGRLGLIQLDRRGRIMEANDRARDVLLQRDGLHDGGGVLTSGHAGENEELQRLLARALPGYGVQGAGGSMKITRRKTRTPLVLEIHPVRGMDEGRRARYVGALVLVVDPARRPRVDPDLVVRFLGLTPAESRVAVAVATGETVAGIADALDCAESTVKTHLKRVYRKLGIRKQTELVQRILSLESLRRSFR
jgi:DNA-binding CsgD family transcriptional regulator/PAS domain-containing protein